MLLYEVQPLPREQDLGQMNQKRLLNGRREQSHNPGSPAAGCDTFDLDFEGHDEAAAAWANRPKTGVGALRKERCHGGEMTVSYTRVACDRSQALRVQTARRARDTVW